MKRILILLLVIVSAFGAVLFHQHVERTRRLQEFERASHAIAVQHIACDSKLTGKSPLDWQIGYEACNEEANIALEVAESK